ncbi:MAG: response regulator [Pseudobdellovibrionaceae bacterium]
MNPAKATSSMTDNKRYILIVEDSPVDFEIIARAFRRVEFAPAVRHCRDGDEAVRLLESTLNPISPISPPSLVLLDLNLPGVDGRQVLATMKADSIMRKIPVIVLSTSNNEYDIEFCFSKGADRYMKKPISVDEFAKTAAIIKNFWEEQILRHSSYDIF